MMNAKKALALLRQLAESYQGTLQEHKVLQEALAIIEEKIKEK